MPPRRKSLSRSPTSLSSRKVERGSSNRCFLNSHWMSSSSRRRAASVLSRSFWSRVSPSSSLARARASSIWATMVSSCPVRVRARLGQQRLDILAAQRRCQFGQRAFEGRIAALRQRAQRLGALVAPVFGGHDLGVERVDLLLRRLHGLADRLAAGRVDGRGFERIDLGLGRLGISICRSACSRSRSGISLSMAKLGRALWKPTRLATRPSR